ncbi:hypothetical protein [Mesorhizobium sp. M2E.F.Ca.ET.209.01.1.1]|uniref:hypothetical protein n=1 Tax=Mesorhizobium sp. M2E.F.Ca.ET.209.01.1.1 TaxID=2500526 RepID=UPI0016779C00|nr:hypothetical protein [Mesorhizobium sp. M2E.F.Ca.ET.209.01.1.1]
MVGIAGGRCLALDMRAYLRPVGIVGAFGLRLGLRHHLCGDVAAGSFGSPASEVRGRPSLPGSAGILAGIRRLAFRSSLTEAAASSKKRQANPCYRDEEQERSAKEKRLDHRAAPCLDAGQQHYHREYRD